jgi:hypothetical protein
VVAEAVAGAQQQHGLALQLLGADALALGQRVVDGHRGHEGLVVQRRHGQAGVGKGLGHDRASSSPVRSISSSLAVKFSCSISGICGTRSMACFTRSGSR